MNVQDKGERITVFPECLCAGQAAANRIYIINGFHIKTNQLRQAAANCPVSMSSLKPLGDNSPRDLFRAKESCRLTGSLLLTLINVFQNKGSQ